MNADLIQQVLAALEREQVRYVVFGAVALALHGLPRATRIGELYQFDSLESQRVQPKDHIDAALLARRFAIEEP